jgi:lipid A 3-O-deacylase
MRTLPPLAACLALLAAQALAGTEIPSENKVSHALETPFDKGKFELQSNSGAYFSFGDNRPTLNYSSTAYRLGVMLDTSEGEGAFRGNFELMLQLFGGSVFDGPGNGLGGAAIILRYNFVQPDARWVPYFQIGVGAVYNDIYKDQSQRLIGQDWEFDLEAPLGSRYFLTERRHWSVNLEGGYRHISNADTADRNVGLNSLGAGVGLGANF